MEMKVGIEKSLNNVKAELEQNNMQAVVMNNSKQDSGRELKKYDAIVASGQDSNFLGMQDTKTKTPVINANGKTAEEICSEVKDRLE
jgi:galactitol-specific phosphotransferase system IIB component